jgi:hypothetical protein
MRIIELKASPQKVFPKRVVRIDYGLGKTQRKEKSYAGIPPDEVPYCICRQLTDKLCAPAAIEMLLCLHSLSVNQWKVAEELYRIGAFGRPFDPGTHPDGITWYLNKPGIDDEGTPYTVKAWPNNKAPTLPDLLGELVRQQPVLAACPGKPNRHAVVIVGVLFEREAWGPVQARLVVIDPSPSNFERQAKMELIEVDRLKYWPISELERISTYWRVRITHQ